MSRPRGRRRPRRVSRWEGCVDWVDVDAGLFGAQLLPIEPATWPQLYADIDLARLPEAEPGLLFNLYIWRKGRKRRNVIRARRRKERTRQPVGAFELVDETSLWEGL